MNLIQVTESFVRDCLPVRDRNGHKGTFGRVHILAGCVGFTGAPAFASAAAVRTGSGLVFLSVPREIWPVLAVKCREAMPSPVPPFPVLLEKMNGSDGVLIGPGLGRSRKTDVRTLRLIEQVQPPLVLDADGINALAGHIDTLSCRRGCVTVLTPHDGELARIGGDMTAPREAAAAAFAADHGVYLIRKGHRTVAAAPDGRLAVNTTGNDGMAKGGSGDVLTGLLTGLLAQGMEPFDACCAAVWIHGRAGDMAAEEKGRRGMTPADMIEKLPYALKEVE